MLSVIQGCKLTDFAHSIVASQWDGNTAFAVHVVRYCACFQRSYESDV